MFDRIKRAFGWRSSPQPLDLVPAAVFNEARFDLLSPTAVRFKMETYHQATLAEAFVRRRLGLPGALECLQEGAFRFELDDDTRGKLIALLEAASVQP